MSLHWPLNEDQVRQAVEEMPFSRSYWVSAPIPSRRGCSISLSIRGRPDTTAAACAVFVHQKVVSRNVSKLAAAAKGHSDAKQVVQQHVGPLPGLQMVANRARRRHRKQHNGLLH